MKERVKDKCDTLLELMDDLESRGEHEVAVQTIDRLVHWIQSQRKSLPCPEAIFTKAGHYTAQYKRNMVQDNSARYNAMFEILFEPAVLRTEKEMEDE